MALKGNLRDFSTTQLLNLINLARKTGTLAIDARKDKARLCFKEGRLVYATIGKGDGLASVLHHAGRITEEQERMIRSKAGSTSDKELGAMLVKAGHVTKEDLLSSVRSYILDNVYPLFTWPEGAFYFESNELPFEDRITVSIDLESVIMEGSRRMKEWERLQDELPDLDKALRFAERPGLNIRNINMSVEEWRVISFINPRNTMRQIAQSNNMSEFQVRKIVYGMLQAGLVELVQPEGAAQAKTGEGGRAPMTARRPAVKRNVVERLIKFFQK